VRVSVRANVRVAGAARRSMREALQVATRAGGFAAIVVVSMTVLGVAVLFSVYSFVFDVGRPGGLPIHELPLMLVGYGFGASFVALFAQLGGRGLHSFRFQLNLSSSVHRVTQLNS